MIKGYDIIGDVHGCAWTLAKLLEKLGYGKQDGIYRHPERQAVFVGDIVDRGPRIREALHLVKGMVDAGAAQCVMGNHEYNAICYTTPDADNGFLRSHTDRHDRCIAETLAQFEAYPDEWMMFLDWFKSLPLFLELPGFRVVHACWDNELISRYKQEYGGNRVTMDFIRASRRRGSFPYLFMDRLTRGTDMPLPDGVRIRSREGYQRDFFRTKFWASNPRTYRDVVFQPDPLPEEIADKPLALEDARRLIQYSTSAPPVFVGHYWLHGAPAPLTPNLACLDYSAVKFGRLVAYRFDGEPVLDKEKFQWVYVDREAQI